MPTVVKRRSVSGGSLLFHAPCFDGLVSAVLAFDFLRHHAGWAPITLEGVNYDSARGWLRRRFARRTAVVDFLYHPQASFWADHHSTSFLSPDARAHWRRRHRSHWLVYDVTAPSCALLLRTHLEKTFGYRNRAYDPLVDWATKIDSADYASPAEAMSTDLPALRVNLSLAGKGTGYPERLVKLLLDGDLDDVARHPIVARRAERASGLLHAGLERLRTAAAIAPGEIVIFDVDAGKVPVPRYGPYFFFPQARYSVGVVRSRGEAKVTAMRNPWRAFESVPLGGVMARHGGGGHHRVASVVLKGQRANSAATVLKEVVDEIKDRERRTHP